MRKHRIKISARKENLEGGMNLVTGGAGLLGWNLAKSLHDRGERVRVFDYQKPGRLPAEVEVVCGDVRNEEETQEAMRGVTTVYHLAAIMHVGDFKAEVVESVNIGGLRNLLRSAEAAGSVRRIVFASSIEIYGTKPPFPCYEDAPKKPPCGYPEHKWRGERMCLEFMRRTGIETAFTRMPLILGPGFYHFKPLLGVFELVRRGMPLIVGDGGAKRGMVVGIRDAVEGLILAGTRPQAVGEAFNICGPDVFTHTGLLKELIRRVKSGSVIVSVPSGLAAPFFEFLRLLKLAPVAPEHFYFAMNDCVWPSDKATRLLGYSPETTSGAAICEAYHSYVAHRREAIGRKNASEVIKPVSATFEKVGACENI